MNKSGSEHATTALMLASGGFFLTTLDILIVNVALTRIGQNLGGGTTALQWVVDGYTLAFATLLLFAGNLADRIGAKRAFAAGTAVFGASSVLCAAAPTVGLLVAARCVQGAGAAVLLPASMALIREAFPDPAPRARALGVWAAGGSVSGATGPLLGGLLTTIDWRLVFAINIPVCALILAYLPRIAPSARRPVPFDWTGQVRAVLGLVALVYGLIEGGKGFGRPVVIVTLAVAVVSLTGFVAVQGRVAHPMMPLSLLRPAGMRIALFGGFSFVVGWYGTVFLASLYLQQHLGLSPLLAGLLFLPSALVSLGGNLASGSLTTRLGTRFAAAGGLSSMTAGLLGLALVAPLNRAWPVASLVILVSAGGSVATPALIGVVLTSAGPEQAGISSAVFNMFRQVGGAVAIAVFGILVAAPRAFDPGVRRSFFIAAALGLLAALACLGIRPQHGDVPAGPELA
jgi:DHA2 family methylenomycin A resistance protein-like MFS transporter